ncbi:hypothetical protein ACYSNN_07105, partial [Peptoniphilus genitalis]
MGSLIIFFIGTIIFCSIIPIADKYKKNKGIEIDNSDVMRTYTYAFTVIEMWLSMIFCQNKLYFYLVVFGLVAYFVYRTLTEDILKNKYKDDPRLYKITTIIVQFFNLTILLYNLSKYWICN